MIEIAPDVHNTSRTLLVELAEGPLTVGRNPFIIPEKKEQVLTDSSHHFIYIRTEVTFYREEIVVKATREIYFSRRKCSCRTQSMS